MSAKGFNLALPCNDIGAVPLSTVHMMSVGITNWNKEKYRMAGFVDVKEGDVVVDCGAFIGAFSLSATALAKKIYAFEPSPLNFRALSLNTQAHDTISCFSFGLYDQDTVKQMNMSATHFDDSFLAPDEQPTGRTQPITLHRFETWARAQNLTHIDFFKLEAEGVENEVLEGIGDFPVSKFAIDCSPERDGQSNIDQIRQMLHARGYETRARRYMLFARK